MGFGKELVQSAREALAIAKGEMEPGRVHTFEAPVLAAIRERQDLTEPRQPKPASRARKT